MEFKLTWAGNLLVRQRQKERSLAVHAIRRDLHTQLKKLRATHPVFKAPTKSSAWVETNLGEIIYQREGFNWLPLVTQDNGLICKIDALILRNSDPGNALADIDNRLKTVFDALKIPRGPGDLGADTRAGKQVPQAGEDPFCVLLEDDSLITHVAVTTDWLLEDVPTAPRDTAVRLVIGVTVRPYQVHLENAKFI